MLFPGCWYLRVHLTASLTATTTSESHQDTFSDLVVESVEERRCGLGAGRWGLKA
jgi:hypothetical protein